MTENGRRLAAAEVSESWARLPRRPSHWNRGHPRGGLTVGPGQRDHMVLDVIDLKQTGRARHRSTLITAAYALAADFRKRSACGATGTRFMEFPWPACGLGAS